MKNKKKKSKKFRIKLEKNEIFVFFFLKQPSNFVQCSRFTFVSVREPNNVPFKGRAAEAAFAAGAGYICLAWHPATRTTMRSTKATTTTTRLAAAADDAHEDATLVVVVVEVAAAELDAAAAAAVGGGDADGDYGDGGGAAGSGCCRPSCCQWFAEISAVFLPANMPQDGRLVTEVASRLVA